MPIPFPQSFPSYKVNFLRAFRAILQSAPPGSLDEAAFPAYAHPNPLINWLFWQRLNVVMNIIAKDAPYESVLDFGCGSGVLLPFLAQHSAKVTGVDIDLQPYELMRSYIDFPSQVEVKNLTHHPLEQIPTASFDLITALDVLEHVSDLPLVMGHLLRILKPHGKLIISGPTENYLYQMGRKIAGKSFSGAFHERGISEIISLADKMGRVNLLATLYWPISLFSVFSVSLSDHLR